MSWEELPHECAWIVGQLSIGVGEDSNDEPVVVIWRLEDGEWEIACRIPVRFSHFVAAAAVQSLGRYADRWPAAPEVME